MRVFKRRTASPDETAGFRHADNTVYTMRIREWTAPHWVLALAAAALPLAWSVQLFCRPRRIPLGLCPTCGYDLRAGPDRCPECGVGVGTVSCRSAGAA
jgi:hypothetical protein